MTTRDSGTEDAVRMTQGDEMIRTHKKCMDVHCSICMEEHLALGKYLREQIGDNDDHLGKFHYWLWVKKRIEPETEYGWGSDAYFDDDLIREYIEDR
jgi:hypothetical protein